MGIKFSDPRKYIKGIAQVTGVDPATGKIIYFSDKVQTSAFNVSVDLGELRAGLGNALATLVSSNADLTVELSAADFSMRGFSAQFGAKLSAGGPQMVCQTVTATGASLSVDLSQGTPVAQLGLDRAYAYVQTIGTAGTMAETGVAYPIDAAGAIDGFSAVPGTQYKVWYFVDRVNAELGTITTAMDGIAMLLTAEMAVYTNVNLNENSGTRVGTLYVSSLVKTTPNGGIGGSQTDYTMTNIQAKAIPNDASVISGDCDDCANAGTPLAYFLYVPCDLTTGIQGLALVGGVLEVPTESTKTISEFRVVLADGSLAPVDNAQMTYTLTGAPTGTSVSGSTLTTGATEGDGEISGTLTIGGESWSAVANLSVVAPNP